MRSGLAAAVDEMMQMREVAIQRRQPRERLSRAVRAIDAALDCLERLNLLDDRPELPHGIDRQIGRLLTLVPGELRPTVHPGETVQSLMDDLYRAQESLLELRSGPEWGELRESEAELPPSA